MEPNPPLEKVEPNFNNGFAPLFLKVDIYNDNTPRNLVK
jgi:hypothetical protein